MNKILLAAGLLAMATAAQADCTSTVNGFYGTIKVGYGVTIAKDKITTKAAKITGKKNYRELIGIRAKSGDELKTLSPAELEEYQKWQHQLDTYNSLITGKTSGVNFDAKTFQGAVKNASLQVATLSDVNGNLNNEEEESVIADFTSRLKATETELSNAGMDLQIDGKKIDLTDEASVTFISAKGKNASGTDVFQPLSVVYQVAEGKTLDIVANGTKVASLSSEKIGTTAAQDAESVYGIQLLSHLEGLNSAGEDDKGLLDRKLAAFKAKILGAALSGKYPGLTLEQPELKSIASSETYSEEIKSTIKEVRSHKNNMNIGLSIGYQHAFGVFYTGIELGAEFTPGKIKIQNVAVDGAKVHHLGASTFTYDKEIPAPVPEISLKTKYSFNVTPMFGITSGNWMFYIPVTLKVTKYDLSVTPSSSFSGITAPTVTYPEADAARVGPYALTDANVTADSTTASKVEEAKENTMSKYKKGKTKFGFEVGLGAKVMLSRNVFVGVRYMYSPKTTLKIDTPAYSSNVLNDMHRLGANHKVSVSSHKGVLEIGYKF